ncbi:M28 family peptidase [Knoellia subterranea]|uniref:Hydrolase n=1 Tax=Knoellia subterranea KCTC 19937 TaxID=1385521 RepID=A0A0A0JPR5_9MICO|nr:M28 family peptidase [Knoellia subterranea]KGN38759.1 hydrolase [Knoellia subterranea KCTC 19937]
MPTNLRGALAPMTVTLVAAGVALAPATQAESTAAARSATSTATATAAASPDISLANTQAHLNQLQSIATANGGNRYTGRAGYTASIAYVKGKLDDAGFTTTVQTFSTSAGQSSNLIAEWPVGHANNVVMLGGHLDSVSNGAGINDNGSGSAGVLESALAYAASGQTAKNRLRVAFWGAEELGLLGSKHYMSSLSTTEKNRIKVYLNFDMIGSPNPGYFVYDDNPAGNGARDELTAWYTAKGIPWEYIDVQGRSDHAAFRSYGIPTAGIFSGAETLKSSSQAQKWGGTAGRAFDPCYHSSCDTTSNINATALDRGADLIGHMLWLYAAKDYGTTPQPTGNLLQNPGFESGAVSWTGTSGPITNNSGRPARTGAWKAWLGGNGSTSTETVQQSVAIPSTATAATLSFWLRTDTAESGSTAYDTVKVQIVDGSSTTTLATYSNVGTNATYTQKSFNITAYKGRTVVVKFLMNEDSSLQTSFVVDDAAVATS